MMSFSQPPHTPGAISPATVAEELRRRCRVFRGISLATDAPRNRVRRCHSQKVHSDSHEERRPQLLHEPRHRGKRLRTSGYSEGIPNTSTPTKTRGG